MPGAIDIRRYEPGDMPTLQAIREAAFAPVFRSFRDIVGNKVALVAFKTAEAEQAAHLDQIATDSDHELWVAMKDGAMIGFVSLRVDGAGVGELTLNAVHPDHAGAGAGSELYKHALTRMKALGASVATVGVGGDASHAAARRAYEKAGFGPAVPSLWLYQAL